MCPPWFLFIFFALRAHAKSHSGTTANGCKLIIAYLRSTVDTGVIIRQRAFTYAATVAVAVAAVFLPGFITVVVLDTDSTRQ